MFRTTSEDWWGGTLWALHDVMITAQPHMFSFSNARGYGCWLVIMSYDQLTLGETRDASHACTEE